MPDTDEKVVGYLTVEGGTYAPANLGRFKAGVHKLVGERGQEVAQRAIDSGLAWVLVTKDEPKTPRIADTLIELQRALAPDVAALLTKQQKNQAFLESTQHRLAEEVGGTGGDRTEGIVLTEHDIGEAGGTPAGPNRAHSLSDAAGEGTGVLTAADLASPRKGAREEHVAAAHTQHDLPHGDPEAAKEAAKAATKAEGAAKKAQAEAKKVTEGGSSGGGTKSQSSGGGSKPPASGGSE